MKKYHKSRRARKARASWVTSDHRTTHPDTRVSPGWTPTARVPHGTTQPARQTREERRLLQAWSEDRVVWKDGRTQETPRPGEYTRKVPDLVYRCMENGQVVERRIARKMGECPDVRPVEGRARDVETGKLSYTQAVQHGIVREE